MPEDLRFFPDFVFMELVELDTVRHVVVGLLRVYDFSTPQL